MNYRLFLALAILLIIVASIFLPTIQQWLYFRKHRKPKEKDFPKADQDRYQIFRDQKTNGVNYNITTEDIINRLKKWEKEFSFKFDCVESDRFLFGFNTLPKDVDAFAKEVDQFCPDIVQNLGSLDELIKSIKEEKTIFFWWD